MPNTRLDLSPRRPIRLAPPFNKGTGKYGERFTIYIEGGHHFQVNDMIFVCGYSLKITQAPEPGDLILTEFTPLECILVTNDPYNGEFIIEDFTDTRVFRQTSFTQWQGTQIADPVATIRVVKNGT